MNKIQCEFKRWEWDFPGGTVDGSPLGGCRGHGFDSWSRRIPHAEEQRGRVLQLLKSACLDPVFRHERSHCNEKSVHQG